MSKVPKLSIEPINTKERAREAADFFACNLSVPYISHGDIIDERAIDTVTWSPDVSEVFYADALVAVSNAASPLADGLHLYAAINTNQIVGIMLIEFVTGRRNRIAFLHDIIVSQSSRGKGVGGAMLAWLDALIGQAGDIGKLFIESGTDNHDAHHFFHNRGFHQTSIVMLKTFP